MTSIICNNKTVTQSVANRQNYITIGNGSPITVGNVGDIFFAMTCPGCAIAAAFSRGQTTVIYIINMTGVVSFLPRVSLEEAPFNTTCCNAALIVQTNNLALTGQNRIYAFNPNTGVSLSGFESGISVGNVGDKFISATCCEISNTILVATSASSVELIVGEANNVAAAFNITPPNSTPSTLNEARAYAKTILVTIADQSTISNLNLLADAFADSTNLPNDDEVIAISALITADYYNGGIPAGFDPLPTPFKIEHGSDKTADSTGTVGADGCQSPENSSQSDGLQGNHGGFSIAIGKNTKATATGGAGGGGSSSGDGGAGAKGGIAIAIGTNAKALTNGGSGGEGG